jgi:hypothetical protein
MEWQELQRLLYRAIPPQGYRRVNLDTLIATPVEFPTLGGDADQALTAALNEPNWLNVAAQMSNLKVKGLWGIWLRRKGHNLHLVYVYGFTGVLAHSRAKEFNEWAWDITKNLKPMLGRFRLDGNFATFLGATASALDGAPPPTEESTPQPAAPNAAAPGPQPGAGRLYGPQLPGGEDAGPIGPQAPAAGEPPAKPATKSDVAGWRRFGGAVLRMVLDMHFADAPIATMITAATDGLQQQLVDDVQAIFGSMHHEEQWGLRNSALLHVAVDGSDLSVHGQAYRGAFNVPDLGQALSFLRRNT